MEKVFELGFSQTKNEIIFDQLPVEGVIPNWLDGSLIRNGPGTFMVGNQVYRHWFDGLAMLHLFQFSNGNVSYKNRYLKCKAYDEAVSSGEISYSEFATDPCFSIFDRAKNIFSPKLTDSAKVNVAKIEDLYLALGETPLQIQFDPKTLESVGVFNYEPGSSRHVTTVHPHFDNSGKNVYQLTTRFSRVSQYRILELFRNQKPRLIAKKSVSEPAYMHSFGLSPRYFILTEFPLVVYPLNILLSGRPFIENFRWKPERGTPFHIFDRLTGKHLKTEIADPFFAFHHVNAFEQGDHLYIDIVAYPDPDIIEAFYLKRIQQNTIPLPGGEFRRYTINLKNASPITYSTFSDEKLELPRFNYPALNMDGNYRFVYGVGINKKHPFSFYNQIVKIDLHLKNTSIRIEENSFPGEPVFIPSPANSFEDDGILISVVLNQQKGNSFLLVLDAQSLEEIGRAEIPHAILFGYHGDFFQEESLKIQAK
jgi:carotenoid cleavage dioxygenase-like enzyme